MAQPWVSKGQARRNISALSALHEELVALDTMTVNDSTDDLMKTAAPDTYYTIRTYIERRISALS